MTARTEVTEILEATTGGTRRHLVDLVTHLDPGRFAVSVICSARRDRAFHSDIRALRARGIDVRVVPMVRRISPWRDMLGLLAVYRHLKDLRPAVVHTHSSKAGFLGRLAARMAGVPAVVHTPHVFPFQMATCGILKTFYVLLERFAARFSDRIICVSEAERSACLRVGAAPPAKLLTIANGIDAEAFRRQAEAPRIRGELGIGRDDLVVGMVGRFTRQKGHVYFLRAMGGIARRFPQARILLIGEGELRRPMERLADRLSLRSICLMPGSREDMPSVYPVFDVFVLASLWEGLPYSLIEAMAAGRAVVAAAVGGIPEAVEHGRTGLLVPPGNVEELARAIADLLADPERRQRLGEAARERVEERFRLRDMVERVERVYEEARRESGARAGKEKHGR